MHVCTPDVMYIKRGMDLLIWKSTCLYFSEGLFLVCLELELGKKRKAFISILSYDFKA